MKKSQIVMCGLCLILALAMLPLTLSCSTSTPAPAPAPATTAPAPKPASTPASTPASPTPAAKTVTLKLSTWVPPGSINVAKVFDPWAKKVEDRTGGRVKIQMYPGEALAKAADQYDAAVNGLTNIAHVFPPYTPGRFPLADSIGQPFIGINSGLASSRVMWALYQKFPEIRAEYSKVKVLFLWCYTPNVLISIDKPIRTIADCKGMKLRCAAGEVKTAEALGFVTVPTSTAEAYEVMQKGVVAAAIASFQMTKDYRLNEVAKYATDIGVGNGAFLLVMNLDTWNGLPKDIQQILDDASGEPMAIAGGQAYDDLNKEGRDIWAAKGHETIKLSSEEYAKFSAAAAPLRDKWASDMQAKGWPGKAILDEAMRLVKEYSK